ncbi:MAG: hypothetical protein KAH17_05260 [Bacteroidales bacterium]|nr:hypothetical protein [Bacteroidales bacterium]
MKKLAYFIGGIALYIGMALVFSSYGNILAHRNINKGIVEKFKTRFLGSPGSGEFKNYDFLFNSSVGYEGQMITKGGKLYVTEETKSLSAEEWIIEGGFSADEPQLQASLRHFYDPTEDPDERYLKDHLGRIMSAESPTFNPRIDHIAWATTEAEHLYNWSIGKAKLKKALETNNAKDRKKHMAYAWRSLGETLHMIADMGCPAHVRDDAHPGLFDKYATSLKEFGNSDPYENICEQLTDHMIGWSEGSVDTDLKDRFLIANTVQEIAHELADYTNKNFFTDQTISGINVVPQIHPEKTYPSPKLEDCKYDRESYSYTKKISGHDVIMCRDKTYAMGLFEKRGYPYMDRICVESQAAALMPQIAEAGANVIRLFIPNLEIVIEELTEYSIRGSVIHTTDAEYKNEILYNGEIELINSESSKKLGVIDCIDGEFDTSHDIKSKYIDEASEGLVARILFGGVTVNSSAKRMGEINMNHPLVQFKFHYKDARSDQVIISNGEANYAGDTTNFVGRLKWDNLSFSSNYTLLESGGSSVDIKGKFSDDLSKIEYFSGKTIRMMGSRVRMTSELHLEDLPIAGTTLIWSNGMFTGGGYGPDFNNSVTLAYRKYESLDEDGRWTESSMYTFSDLNDPSLGVIINFEYFDK